MKNAFPGFIFLVITAIGLAWIYAGHVAASDPTAKGILIIAVILVHYQYHRLLDRHPRDHHHL